MCGKEAKPGYLGPYLYNAGNGQNPTATAKKNSPGAVNAVSILIYMQPAGHGVGRELDFAAGSWISIIRGDGSAAAGDSGRGIRSASGRKGSRIR